MAMMMAAMKPGIFRAAIINDIGPDIDEKGLSRIKGYVGGASEFGHWDDAVAAIKAQGPEIFPQYTDNDWLDFANRVCEIKPNGNIGFAYDPAISQPIKIDGAAAAPPDMWGLYAALHDIPLLLIRGVHSDILARETAEKMMKLHPDCRYAEIPDIGHAPMLSEPQSIAAIKPFLKALK